MVLTISNRTVFARAGQHNLLMATVTFDALYLTGGEVISAALLGVTYLKNVLVPGASQGGYVPAYDPDAGTIIMFESGTTDAALDEVNSNDDLSAESIVILAEVVGL